MEVPEAVTRAAVTAAPSMLAAFLEEALSVTRPEMRASEVPELSALSQAARPSASSRKRVDGRETRYFVALMSAEVG